VVRALRDTRWGGICPLVGLMLSILVVTSVDVPDRGAWLFWAALAVALGTFAGALFVTAYVGGRTWRRSSRLDFGACCGP
jgi:hypothetical protein